MADSVDYSLVPRDEKKNEAIPREASVPPVTVWNRIKRNRISQETENMVGILEVFGFSDGLDKMLMVLGFFCAIVSGFANPALVAIFGEISKALVDVGSLSNYLDTIGEFLQSINKTKQDIISDFSLLCCKDVRQFYGTSYGRCPENYLQETLVDQMTKFATYLTIVGVAAFVCNYGHVTCWIIAAERRTYRIRRACLFNILRQDIGWFDTQKTAQLNSKLADDIRKIQGGTGDKVGTFLQWTGCSLSSLIIGFVYGWKLTLVLLTVTPLLALTTSLYGRVAAAMSNKEQAVYAKAGAIVEDVLGAIRTVVAFGGQEKEAQRYKRNLTAAQAFGVKKGLYHGISLGLSWLFIFSFIALGYWYGGELSRRDGDYSVSDVTIVVFSVMSAAHSLGMASPSIPAFVTARCAAYTIFELINCKSKIDSLSEKGLKPKEIKGKIKLENVHFSYPSRPDVKVFSGLNLELSPGQTMALVGSSGCGKSTVVQMLLRFYDPQTGSILIDGQDVRSLNVKWLRTAVGVVSQEPVLFASTIAENIRYGREGVTMKEIEEATKTANAYDFIMKLPDKFATVVGERGCQLSGGQKQRLAIARALVRDPKILLLDEATSALDTESESIVQDALDKSRQGRTTLIVAHRLSTIKNADLVVGLDGGKVAEMGTHEELMDKQGIYYQLVMNQQSSTSEKDGFSGEVKRRDQSFQVVALTSDNEQVSPMKETEQETEEDLPQAPFSRLMKLAAHDWPFIVLGCLGSFVNGLVWPAFGILMSRLLNAFSYEDENKREEETKINTILLACAGLICLLAYFLQSYMFGRAGEALTTRLRDMCFRSILKQEMSYFDDNKNSVGALSTKLATDASLVQGITGPRLGASLMSLVDVAAALSVAVYHSWKLTLVALGFLPLVVICGLTTIKLLAGQTGKNTKALEGAGKIAVESIGNIKTVASLTIESKFLDLYMTQLETPYREVLRKTPLISLAVAFAQSFLAFAYAPTFLFGAYLIEEGEIEFIDVFMVVYAIIVGSMGLGFASAFVPDIGKAQMSARRIFQILDMKSAIDYTSPKGKILSGDYKAEVTFKDVEFHYPNRKSVHVLQDMTFTVSPGQTVALVGSSGCGKSTSIQLIERFYDCNAGQLALDNNNVEELNLKWLREQIGIVSQEPVLFDTSIAGNIAYGDNTRTVSMDEIITAARNANIHSFISSLPDGYETNVGLRGTQLSGGQKQRIAIARALVRNPKVLLLDEATSALDTENEKVVQEALDKAREGRTSVVIAHRLSTIQTADKICVIKNGKIAESGTHSELIAKQGVYNKLVRNSMKDV